jgi:pyruvate formate-lyase activating enzyme-like uncharacterized protein
MRYLATLIIIAFCLGGCKKAIDVKPSELKGKWNFARAYRNGKEAKTLESAYFEFQDDNSVSSNLFQEKETATFTIDKSKLVINDATPLELEIKSFSKDSMQLEGQMNSFDMQFQLVKVND